jgi:hypothetical protein
MPNLNQANQLRIARCSVLAILLTPTLAWSLNLHEGHPLMQIGGFVTQKSTSQNIGINDLYGDRYQVTKHSDGNVLFGLGYLIDGQTFERFSLSYGLSGFYLAKTNTGGTIEQEHLYTNLAYRYNISHLPVYATAKATVNTNSEGYALTVDAGIGPNFMKQSNYEDYSIDGGITLPDHAFEGHLQTKFSSMAGIGIKINHAIGQRPVECGYRFFYLGAGQLNRRTNQLLNTLDTGNNNAHAIVCAATI